MIRREHVAQRSDPRPPAAPGAFRQDIKREHNASPRPAVSADSHQLLGHTVPICRLPDGPHDDAILGG